MVAAYTPGPWLWQHSGDGDGRYSVWTRQPHTGDLATVHCDDINGKYPAKANAILMHAAPDLLHAAERALRVLKATGESVRPGNALGELQAAIAKATGEQPRDQRAAGDKSREEP